MGSLVDIRVLLERAFPGLAKSQWSITSASDPRYNCIAWAARITDRKWWPDPGAIGYWPAGVAREKTLESFVAAFATLGFQHTREHSLELGMEKVAIYCLADMPKHAARQLPSGTWVSKLGDQVDIEHELHALSGQLYGKVAQILRRPSLA